MRWNSSIVIVYDVFVCNQIRYLFRFQTNKLTTLSLGFLHTTHDIIDSQQHASRLNRGLNRLCLHLVGIPNTQLAHVSNAPLDAVHSQQAVLSLGMLGLPITCSSLTYSQLGDHANGIRSAVLAQRARNHLHGLTHRRKRQRLHTALLLRLRLQSARDLHLSRTSAYASSHPPSSTGQQEGVEHHIAGHLHRVLQVPLDLVQRILAASAQQHRARLRLLALLHKREVLVADLAHLKQPAALAHVALHQLLRPVHDGRARRPRQAVVVALAHTADGGDVRLHQVVLGEVRHALLGDHQVGLQGDDGVAHLLHRLLLVLQRLVPGVRVVDLHRRHRLRLHVLQAAVQKHDAGVLDTAAHGGVGHVLV